ncbi:MAG: DUF362 domain-containing protein [Candidatus Thorarchaeota archaeon]|nr:MAG: DUF362 domain-containing protein [Candidatus Thorarchaeota archaeon]
MAYGAQVSVGVGRTVKKSLDIALSKMTSPLLATKPVDQVIIKPSILDPRLPGNSTKDMIQAVVRVFGSIAPVIVVESDNPFRSASEALSGMGLENIQGAITRLVNLSEEDMIQVTMSEHVFTRRGMPRILTESSLLVNLSTLKVNPARSSLSGSIKNLFGLLPEVDKKTYHDTLDGVLMDILATFPPDLSIMELSSVLVGTRRKGTSIEVGGVVVGTDPVATDAFCASLFGMDPLKISSIQKAYDLGLGEAVVDRIKVLATDNQLARLRERCALA